MMVGVCCFSMSKYRDTGKGDYYSLIKSAIRSKLAYCNLEVLMSRVNNNYKSTFIDLVTNEIFENTKNTTFVTSPKQTKQDAQAYIWIQHNIVYVTFRGTSSKEDVLADMNILPQKLKDGMYVHQGFYLQFMSIESEITSFLSRNKDSYNAIHFAGHSLGGAVSHIAAAHYAEKYPDKKVVCHTFGSPRVGNAKFAKWFSSMVKENIRVVNKSDPVPMIPQRPLWKHTTNKCICIDEKCRDRVISRDTRWFLRPITTLANIDCVAMSKDHTCDTYINRLARIYMCDSLCTMKKE